MISETIRTRFAPSPTGFLHVGGLRTALYNYLFAKRNNGKFILRIEDTDRTRYIEGAVGKLISILNWSGLTYDEGPEKGGDFSPYLQSERLNIYKEHAENLIKENKAYYCFCSQERVAELRKKLEKEGRQAKYDKHCLNLSKDEVNRKLAGNESHVVRLNVPANKNIIVEDIIRGKVEFNSETVDDQILIKSDGYPTYHLASVVDDHLMKITHVIRGEEWLSSTPKHVLLYDFLGWEKPVFAHLPLLLNPDRSKLSKRRGDVAAEDYKAKGYLKEALINFVALLGWTAGDDREYYDLNELVEAFSLERVNKAGAIFNIEKLDWLNAEHLRKKPNQEILAMLKEELSESKFEGKNYSDEYLLKVIEAMKERVSFVKDYLEKSSYFFEAPEEYDEKTISKRWKTNSAELLKKLTEKFEDLKNPVKEDFENTLKETASKLGIGNGDLIHPLRLAISGVGGGPGVFDITYILGKEETVKRMKKAIEAIHKN